ncbi:hypothetical protein H072_3726 [Dactylellina haptotyla CBS 200.50]|uniref:Uncharacterized protein n=1 Tax=Dactylellina haptotyla (strain CBS 200.50) TaxID=1284197 RepID=S8AHG9_DACHA|nr:hypothetical protein H072_3726 [Dactylellina haptotyla CBS 200.50]
MQAELYRHKAFYHQRNDSTDLFAEQYRTPTSHVQNDLPPYSFESPILPPPALIRTPSSSVQPEIGSRGYTVDSQDEEKQLHSSSVDPDYHTHKRYLYIGLATTLSFLVIFMTWTITLSFALLDFRPHVSAESRREARITETVCVGLSSIAYGCRAGAIFQAKRILRNIIKREKRSTPVCLQTDNQYPIQAHVLYVRNLEAILVSLLIIEIGMCVFSWLQKY